jgi:mono/diheme cytochrome c family protein
MRLVCMIFSFALAAMAQIDLEYVIPKENPNTTPTDLKNGQQLFMAQCARCHGPKGEGGRGAVLTQPRLPHAPDDASLFLVIRDGIKGSEMPAGYAVDTRETWQLVAYVRSLGHMALETVPGDPKHGREL